MFAKIPGMILRVGLVFEALAWAQDKANKPDLAFPQSVDAPAIKRAIAFCTEYLAPMALFTYATTANTDTQTLAAKLATGLIETIAKQGEHTFTQRQAMHALPRHNGHRPKASEVNAALRELTDRGWVRVEASTVPKPTGRRSKVYRINTSIMEGFN
jgi:hypothetical protein